jgi:glyoxylase-like metal-dependent hydrolase (beta-lactamase superfamily II)
VNDEVSRWHSLPQSEKGGHVHAFLLDDGTGITLIDALFDTDAKMILAEIAAMGRQPPGLKHIIATHAHRSHIGGLAELKRQSGAKVYAHEWEIGIIEGKRKSTKVSLWPRAPLAAYKLQFWLAIGIDGHAPCSVDQALKECDRVGALTILSTPGHTPGCLSFYWPEKKALFVGDVMVTWPRWKPGGRA